MDGTRDRWPDLPFEDPEALRLLLNLIPDGVGLLEDGRITYANGSLCRILGREPDEWIGTSLDEHLHPDDREAARARMRDVSTAGTAAPRTYRFRRKDGSWAHLRVWSRMYVRGDERILVGVFRDVTETVELEEQLRRAQKMEAMGELTGAVAHDFNNLLTAILGPLEMAIDVLEDDSEVRSELEDARSSARRASTLTRQLLTFSRKSTARPGILDLGEAVEELHSLLTRLVGTRVRLTLERATSPLLVRIDPGNLEQVVVNLVVNARDAMPEGGGIRIVTDRVPVDGEELRRRSTPAPGPHAILRVEDEGQGIPAEERPRIFEPFFTTKPTGTGLGLATVYGIVTEAQGFVRAESTPEGGAAFHVYLPEIVGGVPADEPGDAGEEATGRRDRGEGRSTRALPAERVLVVEDDEVIRRVVGRALRRRGYEVRTAAGGMEAFQILDGEPAFQPHLLLTDVVLSDMSGTELARRVVERLSDLPVLYTSGHPEEEILARLGSEGPPAFAFLEKPFAVERLLTEVHALLHPRSEGCSG